VVILSLESTKYGGLRFGPNFGVTNAASGAAQQGACVFWLIEWRFVNCISISRSIFYLRARRAKWNTLIFIPRLPNLWCSEGANWGINLWRRDRLYGPNWFLITGLAHAWLIYALIMVIPAAIDGSVATCSLSPRAESWADQHVKQFVRCTHKHRGNWITIREMLRWWKSGNKSHRQKLTSRSGQANGRRTSRGHALFANIFSQIHNSIDRELRRESDSLLPVNESIHPLIIDRCRKWNNLSS